MKTLTESTRRQVVHTLYFLKTAVISPIVGQRTFSSVAPSTISAPAPTLGQHFTPRLLCLHERALDKSLKCLPINHGLAGTDRSILSLTCLLTAIRIVKIMRGTIRGLAVQSADPCFAQRDPWIVQIHALRLTYTHKHSWLTGDRLIQYKIHKTTKKILK